MARVEIDVDVLKRELDSILTDMKKLETKVLALKGAINDVITQAQK